MDHKSSFYSLLQLLQKVPHQTKNLFLYPMILIFSKLSQKFLFIFYFYSPDHHAMVKSMLVLAILPIENVYQ